MVLEKITEDGRQTILEDGLDTLIDAVFAVDKTVDTVIKILALTRKSVSLDQLARGTKTDPDQLYAWLLILLDQQLLKAEDSDYGIVYEVTPEGLKILEKRFEKQVPVSVIIPVKDCPMITELLDSAFQQDYMNFEVLVVGNKGDPTLKLAKAFPLQVFDVVPSRTHGRDANHARNVGVAHASGEILAFTDGDCVLPSNWLSQIVYHLNNNGNVACVGGSLIGTKKVFMHTYYDNTLMSKTPKYKKETIINRRNFGSSKILVTANLGVRKELFSHVGGFNEDFRTDYEDYEWLWRVVKNGYNLNYPGLKPWGLCYEFG